MMEALLLALQAEIRSWSEFGGRVFVTEAQDYVPPALRTPACGLRDGDLAREDLTDDGGLETLVVHLYAYSDSRAPGEALLGNPATSRLGVVALLDLAAERLRGNLLGLEAQGLILARPGGQKASISWEEPGRVMTSRALTLTYQREEV